MTDSLPIDEPIDGWRKAKKSALLAALLPTLAENARLRDSLARLMKAQSQPPALQHHGHPEDFVPPGWAERHGVAIPRADGYFESGKAWVRIERGIITNASLKNQSLLSLMIDRELLDGGAESSSTLYMDWRAAYYARVEALRYSDVGTGDPEAWGKEDRFSKLMLAVERKYLRVVDLIVTAKPKERDVEALNGDPTPFIDAFDRMSRAMREINRQADEYLENPAAWAAENRRRREAMGQGPAA